MSASEIEDLIIKAFPTAKVTIDDLRGDGCGQGAIAPGRPARRSSQRAVRAGQIDRHEKTTKCLLGQRQFFRY